MNETKSKGAQPSDKSDEQKSTKVQAKRQFGQKVKLLIDREKDNIQGSFKKIIRMVGKQEETVPIARALIGRKAPDFKATAVFKDEFKEIQLSQLEGKYVLLFFYPLDFTFVCPTELHAFQENLNDFKKRGVEVLACSVDSKFSHLNWLKTPKQNGGIQGVTYGLISDLGGHIAKEYGVLNEDNVAYRALFLLDQQGIVRHQLINDLPLGRNSEEALRMVDALQHSEKNQEVCPANWSKGNKALQETPESVAEYLGSTVQ